MRGCDIGYFGSEIYDINGNKIKNKKLEKYFEGISIL